MPAFYRASLLEFLSTSESELTGKLSAEYAKFGFSSQRTSQTLAWLADILELQRQLGELASQSPAAASWTVLLEYPIPRKEKRIDVVILTQSTIVILELKSSPQGPEALRQAEEYGLLLHYFHEPSNQRKIATFVVSPTAMRLQRDSQQFLPIREAPAFWIAPVQQIAWKDLPSHLELFIEPRNTRAIDPVLWDDGEYRPVPSIIDAARSLQNGLNIREIAHARAARHDVDELTQFVAAVIDDARANHRHAICFVTGVPGSGKTLVGLNLAFSTLGGADPIHFMSGTGPLVKVLQEVLARNHRETHNVRTHEAKIRAKALLENVHVFATEYAERKQGSAPSNHVIIFDEAQRAWNREQNKAKFKRDYSEPEMLLRIMERHHDWAVVIALVGGGQEINNGEAGLAEWGHALVHAARRWTVSASPEALTGGTSVAGSRLRAETDATQLAVQADARLHLDVSVRSLRAAEYAQWVNLVIQGRAAEAAALRAQDTFPILLTRSLSQARQLLWHHTLASSRCGLVASSRAARLRAEGLEHDSNFHANYPWEHWYLAPDGDVRSSNQLEVFATEFEIQGLELDWIGLCWGGDFIWSESANDWIIRKLHLGRTTKWSTVKSPTQQTFRRNAYRVLLTRARQGIVIYIPEGSSDDPTRSPAEFEATARFLISCGARPMDPSSAPDAAFESARLFDR